MSLVLFSLPPAVAALGLIQLATAVPAWMDPFLRSRLTVCVTLGLRFFPIAAVLGLRAWGSTSAAWALAAAVHGVSVMTYLRRVMLPFLLPVGAVATLLVALLATADISTVLLLHPPGESSLPLAIFTVMANAPESLLASLCLVYVAAAAGLLAAVWTLAGRQQT
jgi:ABC-type Fe3+ transport system permease subunit